MIYTKQLNVAMEKWNKSLNEQQNSIFENAMLFWIYMHWNTEERLMLFILLLREGPEQIKLSCALKYINSKACCTCRKEKLCFDQCSYVFFVVCSIIF